MKYTTSKKGGIVLPKSRRFDFVHKLIMKQVSFLAEKINAKICYRS